MSQYQLLPDLTDEEFAALRADIAARGVMVPIELDEAGNILDGHHRLRACYDLGITEFPTIIRPGMTEPEKRHHVRALNLDRRHLTQEQKRAVIADILRDEPERSNRDVAAEVKVDDHTVGAVRRELEATAEIPQLDRTVGQDGKSRPATRPAIVATGKRETAKALSILQEQPEAAPDGPVTVPALAKAASTSARAVRRAEAVTTGQALPDTTDAYRLITAACGDPETLAAIGEATVDLIITDPPYGEQYIDCYEALSDLAGRALKPGGSLLAMAGQSYLPKLMFRMGNPALDLRYQWTLAYLTPGGQSAQLWERRVNTFWKPVLWYVKGTYEGDWVGDVTRSDTNSNDKEHHDWGQSVSGMRDLMERFAEPGMTVLDPFCGGGTTGLIALQMGCRFIGVDTDPDAIAQTKARLSTIGDGTR